MSSERAAALRKRFESGYVTFAVIGQGYVGLPLAMEVVGTGMRCVSIDYDIVLAHAPLILDALGVDAENVVRL